MSRIAVLKAYKNGQVKNILVRPVSDLYKFNFERSKFIEDFKEYYDKFETDIIDDKQLAINSKWFKRG